MMQDEFNNIKVTNEKSIAKAEFGKIQKTEFSENGDMYLHGTNYNANLNQTLNNARGETFAEVGSTSGAATGGVSAGGAVTGGTTGGISGFAAGSVSAIAVASSVAITTISVVTGFSIAMHDYQCSVDLFISSNQVSYELTIDDLKASDSDGEFDYELENYEDEPFSIRVYNNNYDKTEKLNFGFNDGSFENLSLGQTYTIVVTADSISGGKTLYEETFKTAEVASFLDFYVDSAFDYQHQIIYAYLDFVDELDQLSDFALTITRVEQLSPIEPIGGLIADEIDLEPTKESFSATYPLEKKTGFQEVHVDTQDMWIEPDFAYQFEFSYVRNNERIVFEDGEVSFYNAFESTSEVYGVNFNGEANYLDQTFVLNLVYVDEDDILSDFVLHLSNADNDYEIPLDKTTNPQTISAEDYEIDLTQTYNAYLSYKKNGVDDSMELSAFSFTDNSGAVSRFNDFIFPKTADFVEKTFEVRLDYQDDFDIFHQFVLKIYDDFGDFTFEFDLEENTELQTISAPELDYETELEYNYSLTCMKAGVATELDSGRFTFTDKYGRQTKFNGLTINTEGNFKTNIFTVQLDFVDDFEAFDFFSLHFENGDGVTSGVSCDFALEKNTQTQILDAGENGMRLMDGPFEYTLYVDRYEVTEVLTSGTVTFTDSTGAISQFNSLQFNGKMNGEDGTFSLTLNFQDDLDLFSNFSIYFYNEDIDFYQTISLTKTTDRQEFEAFEYGFEMDETYTYELSYYRDGILVTLDPVTFVFEDVYGRKTEFNEFIFDKTGNFLTNEFEVTLDFSDSFGQYSEFILSFYNEADNMTYTVPLSKTTTTQTIDGDTYGFTLKDQTYTYTLTCIYKGETITLDSGNVTFTDNSGASSEFNQFIFDETANYFSREFVVQLDYTDDFEIFSDFTLTIETDDGSFDVTINLASTTDEQTFALDEYELDFDVPYTYTLKCREDGELKTLEFKSFTFTDNSGAVSEFNGLTFVNNAANYKTRSFEVQLDFVDDFDRFSDFTLTITDTETNEYRYFDLEKTTDPQTITINENEWDETTYSYVYPVDILNHSLTYSLSYFDINEENIEAVTDEAVPTFTNSLTTTFTGIESPYEMVQDSNYTDVFYLPIKLDYHDGKGIYSVFNIYIYDADNSENDIGAISFANEVTPEDGDWIWANVSTYSGTAADLVDAPITIVVKADIMDEKNSDILVESQRTVYTTSATLTLAEGPEMYSFVTDGEIFDGGNTYFRGYFSGEADSYTQCQLLIETYTGETLIYSITLQSQDWSIGVSLYGPLDREMFDEDIQDIFVDHTVNISFRYCTVTMENEVPVTSEPITLVCYTNYQFHLST